MSTQHRKYYHEQLMFERLKKLVLAIILIPVCTLLAFLLFGPTIGSIFGIFSLDKGATDEDTRPPATPLFRNIPNATNQNKINLEGFSEPGATIRLFVNGPEKQTAVTDTEGIFTFTDIELINGTNTIFAKATDTNGNESEKSQTITLSVDKKDPELELETPEDEDTIRNLDGRILIKGVVNEKATIKINESLAIQKADQSFEFLLGVSEGEVEIKIEVTDEAGNTIEEELKVFYKKESN